MSKALVIEKKKELAYVIHKKVKRKYTMVKLNYSESDIWNPDIRNKTVVTIKDEDTDLIINVKGQELRISLDVAVELSLILEYYVRTDTMSPLYEIIKT
jgi:hypothetical protein